MSEVYNLDDGISESFTFQLMGHRYIFRQPTIDEVKKIKEISEDDQKTIKFFTEFITPIDKKSPSFEETSKKMTVPYMLAFAEMIKKKVGGVK
jgi:hypothetical protein